MFNECRPSPRAAAHGLVHECEVKDKYHGGDVLQRHHAEVVEDAGHELLQVHVGNLASLLLQLRDSLQGELTD